MNILFVCSRDFDYLQDLTFAGLIRRLGVTAVLDSPWNPKYHIKYWNYPKCIGYSNSINPRSRAPDYRSFDVVILGASKPDAVEHYSRVVSKISSDAVTVFLDGGDSCEVGGDLDELSLETFQRIEEYRPFDLVLKREYSSSRSYDSRIKPFPLSFTHHWISLVQKQVDLFDVTFWAVESSAIRTQALNLLRGRFDCDSNGTLPGQTLRGYPRKGLEYLNALASSRLALNFRGVGWDTLRYWESTALGICTVSQYPQIVIPQPFESGKSIIYIDDDLTTLIDTCAELLSDHRRRKAIGYAARLHAFKYHSNLRRIEALLNFVELSRRATFLQNRSILNATEIDRSEGTEQMEFHRIGIFLFGLMGDVLMRTEAVARVVRTFPNAVFDIYVDPIGAEVLCLTEIKANVIIVERAKGGGFLSKLMRSFSKAKLTWRVFFSAYDLLIDFYISPSTRLLLFLSRSHAVLHGGFEQQTFRVGSESKTQTVSSIVSRNQHHMSLPSLSAAKFVADGFGPPELRPALSKRELGGIGNKAYWVLSSGAGDPEKIPSFDFFSDLTASILERTSLTVKVVLNPGSERFQIELARRLGRYESRVECLALMNLTALGSVFRGARFFCGPDSGLLHLAYGLRIPTLGIFTFTNPNLVDPRSDLDYCLFVEDTERFQEDPVLPKGRKFEFSEVSDKVESFLARVECFDQTKFRPGFLA